MRLFRWDSPFMQKVAMVGNLIVLNILWLLCCIPVITAGAATVAMYYTVFQYLTAEETSVFRPFFKGFRDNFKQATLLWIPSLLIGALLVLDVRYYIFAYETHVVFQVVTIIACVVFLLLQTQLLPIVARYETRSRDAIKNAALLSVLHLPSSVIMAVLNVLPLVVFLAFTVEFMRWLPLWVGLWFSLVAYLNGRMLLKIWKKRVAVEEEPTEEKAVAESE